MKRLGIAGIALVAVFLTMADGSWASSSIYVCVPTTAGAAVTSGGTAGFCKERNTKVALPSESAEQHKLLSILPYLKFAASGVGGKPTIQISGANLQIVSGSGKTNGPVNGAGNLVIGYDEEADCKEVEGCDPSTPPPPQTGSHNLVLGTGQSYTSFGAILGGLANTASGPYSFVIGERDTASGHHASVSGGSHNTSSADAASVSGGYGNTAKAGAFAGGSGVGPSVSGGSDNTAENFGASVSGGRGNFAFANDSVSGGISNTAQFEFTSVSGGARNTATNFWSSVSGGEGNYATSPGGSVSGGAKNVANGESLGGYNPGPSWVGGGRNNTAQGSWSSVSGGFSNKAVSPGASVSGGEENVAGGGVHGGPGACCYPGTGPKGPSVSGGYKNAANGSFSSILGGRENLVSEAKEFSTETTGFWAAVSGGFKNDAKGAYSSIFGGKELTAPNEYEAIP